jgi:hypothetical protein
VSDNQPKEHVTPEDYFYDQQPAAPQGARFPYFDWQQVVMNGGPACFAVNDDEPGRFCCRAERWIGHAAHGHHKFVSLEAYAAHVLSTRTDLAKYLPDTYYTDREIEFRIEKLVSDWQRAITVNQQLEAQLAAQDTRKLAEKIVDEFQRALEIVVIKRHDLEEIVERILRAEGK